MDNFLDSLPSLENVTDQGHGENPGPPAQPANVCYK